MGCQESIDLPGEYQPKGKETRITLSVGFAEETDGYAWPETGAARREGEGIAAEFSCHPLPAASTKGGNSLTPDRLYNLEIQQYDRAGIRIGGMTSAVTAAVGERLTLTLAEEADCQLVAVAWGDQNTTRLGTGSLSQAQQKSIPSATISSLDATRQADMNKMPYVLHLPHVKVENNTLKSPEGEDIRLRLRRLATRLTLNWTYAVPDYTLSQILLQSIPLHYNVVAAPAADHTYPSLLDQYTTLQLTPDEIQGDSYTAGLWIPANVKGDNPAATSAAYRTKQTAPVGSSYVDFIAVNTGDAKKKLSYRLYLGGTEPSDFNLSENTDYRYQVAIRHTQLPVNDRRVTIIDPIPASDNNYNLVATANCFMVVPGSAFCFDPFTFRQNGKDVVNTTLSAWAGEAGGGIVAVKLLWQTKENGDVGDPVMGIVNSEDDHTNVVDIRREDRLPLASNPLTAPAEGRIYCRVSPNTTGGNGVIAAYDAGGNILWSWHVWVTDYNPDASGNTTITEPLTKRKQKYTANGSADQLPMMDRNLGAMAGYTTIPPNPLEMSKTNGFHYQWGRKDLFPSSYSAENITTISQVDSDTPVKGMMNRYGPDGLSYIPCTTRKTSSSLRHAYQHPTIYYHNGELWCTETMNSLWGANTKTVNDPCPAGWKLPKKENYQALFKGSYYSSSTFSKLTPNCSDEIWNNGKVSGGYLLTYDQAGNATYLRMAGYLRNADAFQFVGQQANIWVADFRVSLNYGWNVNGDGRVCYAVTPSWHTSDAHTVRCIQEQE